MEEHNNRVTDIQKQVRYFYKIKQKVKVFHGSTNSTRPFNKGKYEYVHVENLINVIEINKSEKYALVEPNVSLDELVDATLKKGLVPPMVAEFPGITVGGAIQGGSGESSSFKWGGFHDTCLEYEVVTGSGNKLVASRSKNSDLFWGLACAYGSLGVITLVKIKLLPATKYVILDYLKVNSYDEMVNKIIEQSNTETDFVDGIMFSKNSGVVLNGKYTNNSQGLKLASFHRAIDEWFYRHVEKRLVKGGGYREAILLRDYLFRYDKGAFWTAKYGFQFLPFNRVSRFLFSSFLNTRTLYKVLLGSNYAYKYMVQDICLPQDKFKEFMVFVEKQYGIYPLWICPLKAATKDKLSPNHLDTELVINVGVWGPMEPSGKTFFERNRQLEKKVKQLQGRKVLYAHVYYTESEFWDIYDRKWYEDLRKRYHAEIIFPDVYTKVITPPAQALRPSKWRGFMAIWNSPYR